MATDEPSPRWGHYSACIGGQLYVFGGRTKDFLKEKKELGTRIHCFSQCEETWHTRATTGSPPPGLYLGACSSSSNSLFVYGGWDGPRYPDSLHQLNIDSLVWSQLPSGPTRKHACGMIFYDDQLILFGGHGTPSGPSQPGAEFVKYSKCTDGRGWTNELHSFNLKKGECES